MPHIRAGLLLLALAIVVLICVPLQWLAVRLGWSAQKCVPLLFCQIVCRLIGIRTRFRGLPTGRAPRMIVANHVSWTDALVLGCRQAPLRFVGKSEVETWPVLGPIARLTGTIFVERKRPRSILRVNVALCERLAQGEDIVLFAEGTTSDGNRLKRFNAPHFAALRDFLAARPEQPDVAVMPVGIAYLRRDGMPLGRLGRSEVAWYGDANFLPHFWKLLCRGRIDCEVRYGAPIRFDRASNRKAVALQTQAAVRRLLSRDFAPQPADVEAALPQPPVLLLPEMRAV